jgi:hypothetical protein
VVTAPAQQAGVMLGLAAHQLCLSNKQRHIPHTARQQAKEQVAVAAAAAAASGITSPSMLLIIVCSSTQHNQMQLPSPFSTQMQIAAHARHTCTPA